MNLISTELRPIRRIIKRLHGERPRRLRLHTKRLRGGLEASAVLLVRAEFHNAHNRQQALTLVVKRLHGAMTREASVYESLVARHAPEIAPRLLGVEHQGDGASVLYLERVRPVRTWPWRDLSAAEQLVHRLARLHLATAGATVATALPWWDYEGELKKSSEATLELLARCRRRPDLAPLGHYLTYARRLSLALPAVRRELLAFSAFGSVAIHGDVHPGNVLVRRRQGAEESILIDWARARGGSPLEDLNGWLQSLASWEPLARRRHDTLLAAYLSARGMERRLSSDLRAAYWLAGASNAFSGALYYYLSLLVEERSAAAVRRSAGRLARDWLRIVRRAAASWN